MIGPDNKYLGLHILGVKWRVYFESGMRRRHKKIICNYRSKFSWRKSKFCFDYIDLIFPYQHILRKEVYRPTK